MIDKIKIAGQIGRSAGYVFYALGAGARITGKAVRVVSDAVLNKPIYKVELYSNSGTCEKTLNSQTIKQVEHLLESMDTYCFIKIINSF